MNSLTAAGLIYDIVGVIRRVHHPIGDVVDETGVVLDDFGEFFFGHAWNDNGLSGSRNLGVWLLIGSPGIKSDHGSVFALRGTPSR